MRLKPDMESYKCDYCQSVYFPEKNDDGVRVLDEPCDQDCPICNVPLVRAVLAKCPIIYCKKCGGMMVAMGALEGLIDELRAGQGSGAAPAPPDKEDLQRKMNCPQCHHPMDTHFYAGPGNAVISSCEDCCLIWMDRGVLMRIVHTPDAPQQMEPSFSEDYDSQPEQDWNPIVKRTAADMIVDGIVDSFFR
jgi:Zn-finger nucleic acid-binding protein